MERELQNLFHEGELSDFLQGHVRKILQDIDALQGDYVLNSSADDLAKHLVEKYTLEPITLQEQDTTVDYGEAQVNKTHDPMYAMRNWDRPILVPGMFAEYIVPFMGDLRLFKFRPSRGNTSIPRCSIVGSELRARFATVKNDAKELRNEFDSLMKTIRLYLHASKEDVESQNAGLENLIRSKIETRRTKLLKDRGTAEALGFPIRPKAGAQATYAAPVQRKKLIFQLPTASADVFKPEPRLEMAEYEHILNTIANMALVFERSPVEFVKMEEETLRTHILVQLNAQYEGRATGETFNGEGKTDILIRENGKNIFIAECKFWKGAESFTDAIGQLLSYLTWRDAKTAIVLFNRNKDMTAVLKQIPEIAKAHPNFRSESTGQGETRFRFVFNQKNDRNRQILVSVLVFDVPV